MNATSESATPVQERVRVDTDTGGSVVFARLAWPGYTATLDGASLQTKGLGGVFLYVDIPPDTHGGGLVVSFRPPGQRLGYAGLGFGLIVLAFLVVLDIRHRRGADERDESKMRAQQRIR